MTIQDFIEEFPWESKEQEEGIGALAQAFRARGMDLRDISLDLFMVCAFFVQKQHESNLYWQEAVGDQISGLVSQIHALQESLRASEAMVDQMRETLKAHSMLLERKQQEER